LKGTLAVGTVVALTAYLTRLYGPLTQLSNLNIDYMSAMVSFERLFEVLDIEPMIKESPGAIVIPAGPAELTFAHVDFSYPGAEEVSLASLEAVARLDDTPRTEVLHDLSFEVAPGSMTALVGPSGAGKTTISLLVSRLYDVDKGSVKINGVDLRDATTESLNATVGVVTQDPHLFHDTLRVNLSFAKPDASDAEIEVALRAAQIWNLVATLPLGLETVVGERGYRLSGGEKQRVALARMLLKSPRLVVLDEATAHLDAESEAAVQRALDATMTSRTSLVIAHRLSTIRNADQILVVADGTIVQRGTHTELLEAGGLYRTLYETQFRDQEPT
jgi:ATP-binding cassette subfamily B protein